MASIGRKHAYRFGYLKSEQWQNVRAAVLVRDDAKCWFCGVRDLSNDIHHVVYPDNVWKTESKHCITLCRDCHDKVHVLLKLNGGSDWVNNVAKKINPLRFSFKKQFSDFRENAHSIKKVLLGRISARLGSIKIRVSNLKRRQELQQKRASKIYPSSHCTLCKKESITTPKTVFRLTSDWQLCASCFGLFTFATPLNPRTADVKKCVDSIRRLCKPVDSSP